MKIILGADHAGFDYKNSIKEMLIQAGHDVTDMGATEKINDDDYPDYALKVAKAIQQNEEAKGILICGSAVGVSVAANKCKGIRAGICHDTYSAHQSVEHDNANVLCMGSRVIGIELAREIVSAFIHATFSNEERHVRRLAKVAAIEASNQ